MDCIISLKDDVKKSDVKSNDPGGNPGRRAMRGDRPVKLCPFQGFRICDESCKFYVCHGYCKILAERIKKGYANEYLSSVLF